jgi:hypothetical protein
MKRNAEPKLAFLKRVTLCAVLAQHLLAGFANAEALPRTQFTLLNPKADPALCSFASRPLPTLSCEGVAGWRIAVGFFDSATTVTITREGSNNLLVGPMDGRTVPIANVAIDGPRVAWRGLQRGKLFEPYAMILRVQVLNPKTGKTLVEPGLRQEPPKYSDILIIYHLGSEGVCQSLISMRRPIANSTCSHAIARRSGRDGALPRLNCSLKLVCCLS